MIAVDVAASLKGLRAENKRLMDEIKRFSFCLKSHCATCAKAHGGRYPLYCHECIKREAACIYYDSLKRAQSLVAEKESFLR